MGCERKNFNDPVVLQLAINVQSDELAVSLVEKSKVVVCIFEETLRHVKQALLVDRLPRVEVLPFVLDRHTIVAEVDALEESLEVRIRLVSACHLSKLR